MQGKQQRKADPARMTARLDGEAHFGLCRGGADA